MNTQFNCQKYFYFKLFSLFKQLYITIQFSVSTVPMSKTVGWLFGFYGISAFLSYLTPNPFLCKSVLFKTIQFSMSIQSNSQKDFYFKLFNQLYVTIQFSVNTVSMSKTFQFQIIQFNQTI